MAPAMKNTQRWFLGLCSTLLLAAGLARAADKLDPMNQDLSANGSVISSSPDTVNACNFADEGTISSSPDTVNSCNFADE